MSPAVPDLVGNVLAGLQRRFGDWEITVVRDDACEVVGWRAVRFVGEYGTPATVTADNARELRRQLAEIEQAVKIVSPGRVHAALLGGKDTYEADRQAATTLAQEFPNVAELTRASRGFLTVAVRHLAELGVCQFLDLGAGMPMQVPITHPNVHEAARAGADEAGEDASDGGEGVRVVHVDHDRLVCCYLDALLAQPHPGRVRVVHADLCDVGRVVEAAARTLDFGRPVVVLASMVTHYLGPQAPAVLDAYCRRLVPGSYLLVSQLCGPPEYRRAFHAASGYPIVLRSPGEVAGLFPARTDLLHGGVTDVDAEWPTPPIDAGDEAAGLRVVGGLAHLPGTDSLPSGDLS